MIGLLQRVNEASVIVGGQVVGAIERGILVLVGVETADNNQKAERLIDRLLSYRIFPDSENKMNLSVRDINGGVLLVPQFTLAADTKKGMRPSFSSAAIPEKAEELFINASEYAAAQYSHIETGRFGADMKVHLINDGPVTFWITS